MKGTSESPVLPPVKAFNQSRVKSFLRCEKQYSFRYDYPILELGVKEGELVPKHPGVGLKRGDWMHQLLEAHWLQLTGVKKKGWMKRHRKLTEEFNQLFDEEKERYGDMPTECAQMMLGYLRRYEKENERFKIAHLHDGSEAIEFVITVPLKKHGIKGQLKGRIDILLEDLDHGGLWIRDAKWVKTIPNPDERMMSPQNIIYGWGLRQLGYDVRGFIYDYGRTKLPSQPTILKRNSQYGPAGSVSLARCDTTYEVYLAAVKQAHGENWKRFAKTRYKEKLLELRARDVLWYRRETIPLMGPRMDQGVREFFIACHRVLDRGEPVRNYLYNCKFNCDYHQLCVAEFQGLDVEPILKHSYQIEAEKYGAEEIE